MKLNRCMSIFSLSSGLFLLALPSSAQPLPHETTQAAAFARAKAEGKMVLSDFYRPGCSDCTGMDSNFQKTSPALKQWISASCVLWKANVDSSSGWTATPLVWPIPRFLCAFIDPGAPGETLAKYTGLISATTFLTFVEKQAKKNLPIVVINLPAEALTQSQFHSARLGANQCGAQRLRRRCSDHTRDVAAERHRRVPGSHRNHGVVCPGQSAVSEQRLQSYVEYEGNKKSWTNKVTLVTANPAVRYDQTINFATLGARTPW